jgi:hypothetical protein
MMIKAKIAVALLAMAMVATQAPALAAETGRFTVHAQTKDEKVVDSSQAMGFGEYVVNRGRLVGTVVTLEGYLSYDGRGKASLRKSDESTTSTEVLVSHLPSNLRAQVVDLCDTGCHVTMRAGVTAGGLFVIDMDVAFALCHYEEGCFPGTNVPKGDFW